MKYVFSVVCEEGMLCLWYDTPDAAGFELLTQSNFPAELIERIVDWCRSAKVGDWCDIPIGYVFVVRGDHAQIKDAPAARAQA